MKYPAVVLKGREAKGEVISIALANNGQHQDTGAKMIHLADKTSSNVLSKSVSIGNGRASYRGLVYMPDTSRDCKNNTECDALLINTNSRTDTYPAIICSGHNNSVQHEASVSKLSEEQIFLHGASADFPKTRRSAFQVNGFVNDLCSGISNGVLGGLKMLIDFKWRGR